MKEKNNYRIERLHAEEREEIYLLHTFIDYLAFLYTPPLCEVGMQHRRRKLLNIGTALNQAYRASEFVHAPYCAKYYNEMH